MRPSQVDNMKQANPRVACEQYRTKSVTISTTHPPRTEFKNKCKSKLACAESREMAKTLQIPMRNATHTKDNNIAEEGQHKKIKTPVAVAWTSSPPPPSPPNPRRELKEECKSKLACAESRDANTDAKGDTDRKTPKKTMRNGQPSRFLDSAARRLWHFFC